MLMMKKTKATGSAVSSSPTLDANITRQHGAPTHGSSPGWMPGTCSDGIMADRRRRVGVGDQHLQRLQAPSPAT